MLAVWSNIAFAYGIKRKADELVPIVDDLAITLSQSRQQEEILKNSLEIAENKIAELQRQRDEIILKKEKTEVVTPVKAVIKPKEPISVVQPVTTPIKIIKPSRSTRAS
ncbi:MAG: hypothetical protein QG654_293 [Patescibacteria group bacterium]|nr:hypothetical protein [Patescibacteria group bacterium]